MKVTHRAVIFLLIVVGLSYLACRGYGYSWTGFQGHINDKGEKVPAKKLWDWLQLLIVPILLAVGAWWLNKTQKKSELLLETDRQRQKALEDYFGCMTELLLKENLRDSVKGREAQVIARTRTLAVLRILDGARKSQALQFLSETGLIGKDPIVDLNGANLKGASLAGAALAGTEMRGVYFNSANLTEANLEHADLRGSDFSCANMTEARLVNANLTQATLRRAILRYCDLTRAVVDGADFSLADMKYAKLSNPNTNELKKGKDE